MENFWAEMKRRRVYRAGAAYVVVAWGLTQVVDILSQVFALPLWIGQSILIALALGLPLTLFVAWTIEGRAHQAIASAVRAKHTGVDWLLAGTLVCVIAFLGYQQFTVGPRVPAATAGIARSIAVLPFSNLSPDPENAFFADGIHDDLLTQLSKISALRVISRTSVMEYRDSPQNMRDIGAELGVATILEGGVQRAGGTLRINVQLINAETDEHLWAESYDRDLTAANIFAIQSEITGAITSALQATLLPQEIERLNEVPTENTRAYDFYLSGNHYFDRTDYENDLPLAQGMYESAVDEDPNFALAWTALSRTHSLIYWFSIDRTDNRLTLAREAAEHALRVSPNLPEAHLAMGDYYYRSSRDYARALAEYDLAGIGMPRDTTLLEARAYIQRRLGQWDESLASMTQAIALDPRNVGRLVQQGHTYRALRNYAEADRHYQRALEIAPDSIEPYMNRILLPLYRDGDVSAIKTALENPPFDLGDWKYQLQWTTALYERDYDAALAALDGHEADPADDPLDQAGDLLMKGATLALAGRPEDAALPFQNALALLQAHLPNDPENPRIHIALGEALAGLGQFDDAIAAALHAQELRPTSADALDGPVQKLDAALVLVSAGDYETAVRELDSYLGTRGGGWTMAGILPDPRIDPIRDDPRFQALVAKYQAQ